MPFARADFDVGRDVPKLEATPVGKRSLVRLSAELPAVNVPDALPRPQHVRAELPRLIFHGKDQLTAFEDRVAYKRDHFRHAQHHATPFG
jgi:hypothetical protein